MPGHFFAHFRITVGDVAVYRIREEEHVLSRHADVVPQGVEIPLLDGHTVDLQDTGSDVVKPGDQIHEQRLAGTGVAHDSDRFAGLDM